MQGGAVAIYVVIPASSVLASTLFSSLQFFELVKMMIELKS